MATCLGRARGDNALSWSLPATSAPHAAHAAAASTCVPRPYHLVATTPGPSSTSLPLLSPPHEDSRQAHCLVALPSIRHLLHLPAPANPVALSKQWRWRVLPKLCRSPLRASAMPARVSPPLTSSTPSWAPCECRMSSRLNTRPPPPRHSPLADHTSPWSAFFEWGPPCPDSPDGCAALPSRPSATSLPASLPASRSRPGRHQCRHWLSVPPLFCDMGCHPISRWAGQWWPNEHNVVYLFLMELIQISFNSSNL
jgi:hypothetical protein